MVDYDKDLKKYIDSLSAPNIAIIGLTGVGKSSLINGMFGIEIAPSGAGLPVTTKYEKYSPSAFDINLPVNLYDSPGYEPGKGQEQFVQETIDFLKEKKHLGGKEQIHLIWYLINASTARLTEADKEILEQVNQNHIPAIIVLSKSDIAEPHDREKVKNAIRENKFSKFDEIVEVAAKPLYSINGKPICEPYGMKDLVDLTMKELPTIYADAFLVAQTVDIESKKELAWKYVREASWACFAAGALPIPLTAPGSAISALGYMYGQIIALYGHSNHSLLLLVSGMTFGGFLTLVTEGVLDLFSPIFTGLSILTGASAATFTAISGKAFTETCERLAKKELTGSEIEITEQLRKIFQEEFRKCSNLRISHPNDLKKF